MRYRTATWATAIGMVLSFASLVTADEGVTIGQLTSAAPMRYHDRMRYVLTVASSVDGERVQVGVENADEKAYKVEPKADLLEQIKTVSPGDMVKIIYTTENDKTHMMRSIAAYSMQPGMELPNAYLFHEMYDHSENQKTLSLVDAKRFDQVISFALPNKKDGAGAAVPDPELTAAIGKLKDGQVVLIDAAGGAPYPIIRSIEVYNAPQSGTLKAIKPAELDGNKTTAADIDVDGTAITATVPGHLDGKRWIVDTKILSELRRFKPGANVTFRIVEDNGNSLLRDIRATPKVATPKPAGGSSGGSTGSTKKK